MRPRAILSAALLCALLHAETAQALVARKPLPVPVSTPVYGCTPKGFTLSRTKQGYHLNGVLDTPTPGYSYRISTATMQADGTMTATLTLTPPAGMVIQVLGKVSIDAVLALGATLKGVGTVGKISVTLDKPFNWGPSAIDCKMVGMTQ